MLLADYTLDSNIKVVKQYIKAESRRQDFYLCIEVLNQLEEFLDKHHTELSKGNVIKFPALRIMAQSLYISFIVTYSKTFLSSDGGTMLNRKEASKIIHSEWDYLYHEDIIRIRNTYVGHGQPGSIYEKQHVSYKLFVIGKKRVRKFVVPSGARTFIPSKVELLYFKKLSEIFFNYFTIRANESMQKIIKQLHVPEVALLLNNERTRIIDIGLQNTFKPGVIKESQIESIFKSMDDL